MNTSSDPSSLLDELSRRKQEFHVREGTLTAAGIQGWSFMELWLVAFTLKALETADRAGNLPALLERQADLPSGIGQAFDALRGFEKMSFEEREKVAGPVRQVISAVFAEMDAQPSPASLRSAEFLGLLHMLSQKVTASIAAAH